MQRNNRVFVLGIILILLSIFLMKYSINFLWGIIVISLILFFYYEMTLSPEEKERRRLERERREAERRHLEFVRKEARARAEGEAYGSKIGWERAKEDIVQRRRFLSPFEFSMFGRPPRRMHRRKK